MNGKIFGLLAVGLLGPMSAEAAAFVTFEQSGGNVVATLSGNIDLTNATLLNPSSGPLINAGVYATVASFATGVSGAELKVYSGLTGPSRFGTIDVSVGTLATTSSGDALILNRAAGTIYLPALYVSGTPLQGTATFNGVTLAGLGLALGDPDAVFSMGAGADTLTVRVGSTPTATSAELSGFYPPVDSPAVATNLAKGGQTIPLKFYAETAAGPLVNLTSVELSIVSTDCGQLDEALDAIESYATLSGTSLQNLGGGYYQYNWKTVKSDTGCRVVTLTLPASYDADALVATFKFR